MFNFLCRFCNGFFSAKAFQSKLYDVCGAELCACALRESRTVPSENNENSSASAAATDDVGKVLNLDWLKDSTL